MIGSELPSSTNGGVTGPFRCQQDDLLQGELTTHRLQDDLSREQLMTGVVQDLPPPGNEGVDSEGDKRTTSSLEVDYMGTQCLFQHEAENRQMPPGGVGELFDILEVSGEKPRPKSNFSFLVYDEVLDLNTAAFVDEAVGKVERRQRLNVRDLGDVGRQLLLKTHAALVTTLRDNGCQPAVDAAVVFLSCDEIVGTTFRKKQSLDGVWRELDHRQQPISTDIPERLEQFNRRGEGGR